MLELIKCRFRKSDCFIFGNRNNPTGICSIADLFERLISDTEESGFIRSFVGEILSVFLQVFFAWKFRRFHSVFSVWSAGRGILKIYGSSHKEFREGSVIIRNQIKKLVRTSFHGNIIRHIERPDDDKKDCKCGEHGNPYELSSKLLNHVYFPF